MSFFTRGRLDRLLVGILTPTVFLMIVSCDTSQFLGRSVAKDRDAQPKSCLLTANPSSLPKGGGKVELTVRVLGDSNDLSALEIDGAPVADLAGGSVSREITASQTFNAKLKRKSGAEEVCGVQVNILAEGISPVIEGGTCKISPTNADHEYLKAQDKAKFSSINEEALKVALPTWTSTAAKIEINPSTNVSSTHRIPQNSAELEADCSKILQIVNVKPSSDKSKNKMSSCQFEPASQLSTAQAHGKVTIEGATYLYAFVGASTEMHLFMRDESTGKEASLIAVNYIVDYSETIKLEVCRCVGGNQGSPETNGTFMPAPSYKLLVLPLNYDVKVSPLIVMPVTRKGLTFQSIFVEPPPGITVPACRLPDPT